MLFAVILLAIAFVLPTIPGFRESFKEHTWISKPIALGLDLSGGVHLLYEVQAKEAVKSRLQSMGNSIRSELRKEKVAAKKVSVNDLPQLEISLLSDRGEQTATDLISNKFKELVFVEKKTEDGLKLVYGFSPRQADSIEDEAVSQAVETLRNRVDQFGLAEPIINRIGGRRILLQMPGIEDVESVKRVVGKVAKLEFRLVPIGGADAGVGTTTVDTPTGGKQTVEDQVLMTGDAVADARVQRTDAAQVEVSLKLTGDGSNTFSRITSDNVGRQLAIILDGKMHSAPRINEPILGGQASITGGFSMVEAKQLALVLRSGALPAPLTVLEERTVGPSLGLESIKSGIAAIALGFVFIIVFMLVYYKKSGLVAIASLGLNMLFIVAILSAFGATLTLPGLAGLALTIGMAVDSNVIIFERIRDELRNGASRDAAVHAGFEKALSAIIDSNVTTLLAGLILFYVGTGPIRGFAITLTIGIITTIYCATFCCRLAFDALELKGGEKGISI